TLEIEEPKCRFYTLIELSTMQSALTTNASAGVRIPVFGVTTQGQPGENNLTHGSLLFATGMETALKFLDSVRTRGPVKKAIIVLANDCHDLGDGRYRAYFGIS